MGSAVLLLLAAVASFLFYKKRRDAIERQKAAEFKAEVTDTEMKALRLQMNPHFIFNSLNSISDYIIRNDIQQADYYLARFARLMRMILENSEQPSVPLATDLEALELYMQLEALRLNHKFTYEIQVDPSIDRENTLIPPLLLQPFVENSILHGIARKQDKGKIIIRIYQEQNMLYCLIEDNGIGREQASLQHQQPGEPLKRSMGMKITRARIDIINKMRKANATVEIADLAEGTQAKLRLPLELSF